MNKLLHNRHCPTSLPMLESSSSHTINSQHLQMNLSSAASNTPDTMIIPIIGKLFKSICVANDPVKAYQYLHLVLGCASKRTIMPMIKKQLLLDLPSVLNKLKHNFELSSAIANIAKAHKIPRGPVVDVSTQESMDILHIDFSFYGETSLRGYKSALDIVCGLARSLEFCDKVINLTPVLDTTGGGNSESNGKIEHQHQTRADMVHSFLAIAKIIMSEHLKIRMQLLWCFAYQHACLVSRYHYNRLRQATPYFLVFGKHPSINNPPLFGSKVVIVDPHKHQHGKLSDN